MTEPFGSFEVKGLKELDKQLKRIGGAFRWKTLRKGMRDAMRPVHYQSVAGYAGVSRNLALQIKTYSSTKNQTVDVGWKWPKNLTSKRIDRYLETATRPAYYARFVEKGFQHRGGKTVEGKRILANAFDSQEQQIIQRFIKSVDASIQKALRSGGRGS